MKPLSIILFLVCTVSQVCAQTTTIDSLNRVLTLHPNDTIGLDARLNLIFELTRSNPVQARQLSLQTAALAESMHGGARWLNGSYTYLVVLYREAGQLDSARYYLSKAEKLCEKNFADKRMRSNFLRSAGLFYKNIGEYKMALPYMQESLELLETEDETMAGQLLNLGNLYYNLGEFKDAANHHLKSLRLFEKLKSLRGQSFCLQGLGSDFLSLKQLTLAKNYFEKSLLIKKELNDKRGILTTTVSLGDIYSELGEYKKSESSYTTALAAARNLKLQREEARVLHQAGLLYRRMHERDKARDNFNESLSLSNQMGDSIMIVKTKSELGTLDLDEQSQKNSEVQMLEGLNTLIRTGDQQQEAVEYLRLSEYYSQKKNYERALYYLRQHVALSDSIAGTNVLVHLKDLEEKYKSEKKEKEIELLKKDQELQALEIQRQRANTTIILVVLFSFLVISALLINRYRVMNRINRHAELELMRQHIARDLHDDLGSALSSINIMSQLALQQPDNVEHIQKISTYSSKMMENMSDMVWSINPANDSMEQVLVRMKEFAAEILEPKNIRYVFQIEEGISATPLDVEKRKSLFLIFKEAINNVAKYSEATLVEIRLGKSNQMISLHITDDGKGFDTSTPSQGNGLKNMAFRADTLKGNWKHTSETGRGTSIVLDVPIT